MSTVKYHCFVIFYYLSIPPSLWMVCCVYKELEEGTVLRWHKCWLSQRPGLRVTFAFCVALLSIVSMTLVCVRVCVCVFWLYWRIIGNNWQYNCIHLKYKHNDLTHISIVEWWSIISRYSTHPPLYIHFFSLVVRMFHTYSRELSSVQNHIINYHHHAVRQGFRINFFDNWKFVPHFPSSIACVIFII